MPQQQIIQLKCIDSNDIDFVITTMQRSVVPRNYFRKLVVKSVKNSKVQIQNDCLVRLYDADAELKAISTELDSFDGKKDPIRCNLLVNQLRTAQDKVISLIFQLMDDCNCERASRDYRMKFPDEILLSEGSESLNGQIWFGAECLSAGSNILNHTKESTMLRPMARTLTTHLDSLRNELRELVISAGGASRISHALIRKMSAFDHIFATFEFEYVRTMLPIRTVAEIEKLQEVAVLFSETLIDCLGRGLIKQDDIDEFQPIVMIAIPRLAIVRGLLYRNENPIYTRHKSQMCSLFLPFHGPLHSIRKLLRKLSNQELFRLEKMLANDQSDVDDQSKIIAKQETDASCEAEQQTVTIVQTADKQQSVADLGGGGETSQGNNYQNMLMDGLEYPVGQHRSSSSPSNATNQDSSFYDMPTSSKSLTNNTETQYQQQQKASQDEVTLTATDGSPVDTLPTTSSIQCNRCALKQKSSEARANCDKDCCLSPPESDAQLDKLIAEFNANSQVVGEQAEDQTHSTNADSPSKKVNEQDAQQDIDLASQQTMITNPTSSSDVDSNSKTGACTTKSSENQTANTYQNPLSEDYYKHQATQQLLHRLFVAVSGVADQLQSNFASDLRFILRHIFIVDDGAGSDENEPDNYEQDNDYICGEDDELYERGEFYSDNSDSSLPSIEQGVEAQELVEGSSDQVDARARFLDEFSALQDIRQIISDSQELRRRLDSPDHMMQNSQNHRARPGVLMHQTREYDDASVEQQEYNMPNEQAYGTHAQQQHRQQLVQEPQSQQQQAHDTNVARADYHHNSMRASANDATALDLYANTIMVDARSVRAESSQRNATHHIVSPNEPSIFDQRLQMVVQQADNNNMMTQSTTSRGSQVSSPRPLTSEQQQQYQRIMIGSSAGVVVDNQRPSRHGHHHHHHHRHAGSASTRSHHMRNRCPPVWVPDQLVVACSSCNASFTLFRRRHHCRACGQIFCSECSKYTRTLDRWGYNEPVRVCESCYNQP